MSKILFLDLDLEGIANLYAEWCSEMDRDDCCTERTLADAVPALIARVRELEAKQDQMLKAAVVGATAVERARCVGVFEEMVNLYPDLETFRREIEEGR